MKAINKAQAKQLERIYLHFNTINDRSDRTANCLRQLKIIVKKLK